MLCEGDKSKSKYWQIISGTEAMFRGLEVLSSGPRIWHLIVKKVPHFPSSEPLRGAGRGAEWWFAPPRRCGEREPDVIFVTSITSSACVKLLIALG